MSQEEVYFVLRHNKKWMTTKEIRTYLQKKNIFCSLSSVQVACQIMYRYGELKKQQRRNPINTWMKENEYMLAE